MKTEGFHKAGLSFEKHDVEVITVVNYQRSRDGGTCDRFTVNLGIASRRLFAFEDPRTGTRTPVECCHWTMRLGRTLEPPSDAWWELCSAADVPSLGRVHQEFLKAKALPFVSRMASDDALRAEWVANRAPGLTDLQRLLNLAVLLDDSEHRDEQRAVIEELKELAIRKGFQGRVAVHLEKLGAS